MPVYNRNHTAKLLDGLGRNDWKLEIGDWRLTADLWKMYDTSKKIVVIKFKNDEPHASRGRIFLVLHMVL